MVVRLPGVGGIRAARRWWVFRRRPGRSRRHHRCTRPTSAGSSRRWPSTWWGDGSAEGRAARPGLVWSRADGPTKTVYSGPAGSAILWLSAVGHTVWAGVDEYGSGGRPSNVTRLVAVNQHGSVVLSRPPRADRGLSRWSQGGGGPSLVDDVGRCGAVTRRNWWRSIPVDGGSHLAEPLPKTPPGVCNDADTGSQVAAVGPDVFVLIPSGSRRFRRSLRGRDLIAVAARAPRATRRRGGDHQCVDLARPEKPCATAWRTKPNRPS